MAIHKIRVNGVAKQYGLIEALGDYVVLKELKKNGQFHSNRKYIIEHIDNTDFIAQDKHIGVGQIVELQGYGMNTNELEVGNHRVRGSFHFRGDDFHFEALSGYHGKTIKDQIIRVENCLCFTHIWSDNIPDENDISNINLRRALEAQELFLEYTTINIMHVINTIFQDNVIGNVFYNKGDE